MKHIRTLLLLTPLVFLGAADSSAPTESGSADSAPASDNQQSSVDLSVDITDLRDAKGTLRVSVYSAPEGFLKDDSKALARGTVSASADERHLTFHLPPGKYAVALFHDENDNGKLDTNFLGIPTEGYGVSNNPKPRFRAPRYKEALFDLPKEGKAAKISLQYVG